MAGPVMLFLLLTSEGAFAETLQGAVAAPQGAPSEAPPQGGATTAPPPASQDPPESATPRSTEHDDLLAAFLADDPIDGTDGG